MFWCGAEAQTAKAEINRQKWHCGGMVELLPDNLG